MGIDNQRIEDLMLLLKKHGLKELEIKEKDLSLKIVSQDNKDNQVPTYSSGVMQGQMPMYSNVPAAAFNQSPMPPPPIPTPPVPVVTAEAEGSNDVQLAAGQKIIRSPFVGTYYESPSPEAETFVQVGDQIKKGQVLCIVEAMKLMNEIEAETSGKIIKILCDNEQPVEFDQPIFIVE